MSPGRRHLPVVVVLVSALLFAVGCSAGEHTAGAALAGFGPALAGPKIPPGLFDDIARRGGNDAAPVLADRSRRAEQFTQGMRARTAELKQQVSAALERRHRELATDLACSLALQNMSGDEQNAEAQLTRPANGTPDLVHNFEPVRQTVQAFAEIAQKAAFDIVARILGPGATTLNAWAQWGNDVVGTAQTVLGGSTSDLSQQVNVNGYLLTRAAYFYARVCLKPPG